MKNYCYILNEKTLSIVPKNVLKDYYDGLIKGVDLNLEELEMQGKAETKEYKRNVSLLENMKKNYKENIQKTEIPDGEYTKVEVLSSAITNNKFVETHKDLLEGKHVKIILNDGINLYYEATVGKEVFYQEQDLDKRETDFLLNFYKNIKFKSVKFKENIQSDNEYTFDELENARKKVWEVSTVINSYKNLSPYEKLYLAFSYVQAYEYSKADKGKPAEDSRALIQILNSKDIVCAGKANMLKAICDQIGIPCIYRKCDCHAINTIAINDPKYSMHGIFNIDATNQYRLDFLLFHEDSNKYKELFVKSVVDIDWIRKLSKRERDYLMKNSGLDKLPKEVLEASKNEFAERDKEILKKFKEIDDSINFNLFNKNKSIEELNDQKMAHYHLMLGMQDIADGIKKDEVVKFSKLSTIYRNIPYSLYNTENHELVNLRKLIDLGCDIDEFEFMKSLSTNEDELRKEYKDVYEFFDQKGEEINPETMARAKKELCERIVNSCEKSFYFSKEIAVAIDDYLKSFRKKDDLKIDNKIDVGKQIENLADSLVEMQGAHTKDDFDLTRAIIYGSRIDSAKTNNYSGELEKSQIEYWQECARAYGLDPEKIIPTADVRDFSKVSKSSEGAGMTM